MGWQQPFPGPVIEQPGEQAGIGCARASVLFNPVISQPSLHRLPQVRFDDRHVLAGIDIALVHDPAAVEPVLQHRIERPSGQHLPAAHLGGGSQWPGFAAHPGRGELRLQQTDRAECQIELEDLDDSCRLGRVDHQLALLHVVAERHNATHPHAFALRSCGQTVSRF